MTSLGNRIVVLIDMDCFFCQVETRLNPEFVGKPLAVVQYNPWKSGGIIAVNYEARDFGVTRHMRGDEAKEKCPDIILASVPSLRGKADTSRYRSAGREVIDVLKSYCKIIERASVDEAYLDITQLVDEKISSASLKNEDILSLLKNTYVVGHSDNNTNDEALRTAGLEEWLSDISEDEQILRLAFAGIIVENLRDAIYKTTSFRCSAGISYNKILAKLACGMHKPNRQTILSSSAIPELFSKLPVKKVRNLGGKLGDIITDSLKCNVMSDLLQYSLQYLQNRFDDKGLWLYNIARGIDNEPVNPRLVSKSIGACKNFPGKQAIVKSEMLKHWVGELSAEVSERLEQDLEENERRATLITVSFHIQQDKNMLQQSKSGPLASYKAEKIADQCFKIISKAAQQQPICFLGISVSKFVEAKGSENFVNFFKPTNSKPENKFNQSENMVVDEISNSNTQIEERFSEIDSTIKDTVKIELKETVNHNSNYTSKNEQNMKSSPCSTVKNNLQSDKFKKSFFMNVFKEKSTSKKSLDYENASECEKFIKNETTEEIENITNNEHQKMDNFNIKDLNKETVTKLQDIFPDLNDIDMNIVKMLPGNLQLEAKKILKKNDSDSAKKLIKDKLPKPKLNNEKKNNSIQNFFIKTNSKDISNDNLKKCSVCDQLILKTKFEEHNDYHVAQDLQRQLNKNSNENSESRKRKFGSDDSIIEQSSSKVK